MTGRPTSGAPSVIRTFLIADIRGYTRFTAQLGDEAASRLAAKFAQIAAEGVESWDGTLLELRGDEALAVFDSARQALRAAVELQSAFADETHAEPHLPLTVGIGLDAGEAIAVGDGYRGAALNLAARLCATAAAGEIRTTESLTHLVGRIDGLTFTPLEPTEFKGIDGPVTPVLVAAAGASDGAIDAVPHPAELATSSVRSRMPAELDSVVPFAGRERELRTLGWHWRRARRGHPRVVVVVGRPGIGKTRLAAELAALARSHGATVVYRGGATIELGQGWTLPDGRPGPTLAVLDDLHVAGIQALDALRNHGVAAAGRATLTLVTSESPVPRPVQEILDGTDVAGQMELGPLGADAIRAILGIYAADTTDDVPLGLIEAESEGVPAAVHRVASQWARSTALRRVGSSAQRAADGRRELRAAEEELVADVGDLERARDRARLLVEEPGTEAGAAARAIICPYKGLSAFESADAEYFFGRDRLVGEIVAKLVGSPFVAVVGASGSGKSSAIRAGLLPALASGVLPGSATWIQVVLRPGTHPVDELRRALGSASPDSREDADSIDDLLDRLVGRLAADQRLLVVVDQFEELFTAPDEAEREAFVAALTTPRPGAKVIVSLRADHYGHGAAYPALARLLGADQVLVGPVGAADLAAIIERPARSVGLRVEPELTTALVEDAGAEPGALPLLSTALLELWHARIDGVLTLASYHARGGLRGAVARLAESAFARLTPEQQATARSVLLRLAGHGEGDALVRRRVPIVEFDVDDDADVREVLDVLTTQRLLSTGDGYVEVAHEALLREWPRLQSWLEEDAAGRTLRLHLIAAAREWDERGREPGDLYRGARLAAIGDWAAEHDPELNATERAFLDESRQTAEREAGRQRRTNRILRVLLAGAGVFLVAALVAGGAAFLQRQDAVAEATRADAEAARAEREREAAQAAEAVARSRELAASAIAYLDDDPSLSKLLALSAASIADPPIETVSALHQAWAADRIVDRHMWPAEFGEDVAVVFSPDGSSIAVAGDSHALEVVDWRTDEVVWTYDPGSEDVWISQPHYTRDGASIVASVLYAPPPEGDPNPPDGVVGLHFWDASTGVLERTIDIGPCGGFLMSIGDTHAVIAAEVDEGPCTEVDTPANDLVDLNTGERTRLTAEGGGAAMSADGRRVGYEDFADSQVWSYVVDTVTGERILTIDPTDLSRGQQDGFTRALNDDGTLFVYGDRPIQVWDVDAGEIISSFGGHAGESNGIAFADDGETIYSTGRDATLRHWDARTGDEIERFAAVGSGRISLVGSDYAAVGRQDESAVIVDLRLRAEIAAIPTCHGFAPADQLGVSGGMAALSVLECEGDPATGTSLVADLAAGEIVVSVDGALGQDHKLSPDGSRFVRQEGVYPMYGPLTVRDASTGSVLVGLADLCTWDDSLTGDARDQQPGCDGPPHRIWAQELRWSANGTRIVGVGGASGEPSVGVWDAVTGEMIFRWSFGASSAILTPDGSQLLVATEDDAFVPDGDGMHFVRFDVETGEQLEDLSVPEVTATSFIGHSADGSTLFLIDQPSYLEGGTLRAISADGVDVLRSRERISEGSVKATGMNADGSRIVTGSSDGFVRVWDAGTFALVHELFVGDTQVQGVAFVNDTQVALAPEEGDILVQSVDTDELLAIVRESLTRGFTEPECDRFNFGDDCPTLEELRSDS